MENFCQWIVIAWVFFYFEILSVTNIFLRLALIKTSNFHRLLIIFNSTWWFSKHFCTHYFIFCYSYFTDESPKLNFVCTDKMFQAACFLHVIWMDRVKRKAQEDTVNSPCSGLCDRCAVSGQFFKFLSSLISIVNLLHRRDPVAMERCSSGRQMLDPAVIAFSSFVWLSYVFNPESWQWAKAKVRFL